MRRRYFFSLYFVILAATEVASLHHKRTKCNYCRSGESIGDCRDHQTTVTCGDNKQCFQASYKIVGSWEFHSRGCVTKGKCNSFVLCGSLPQACKLSCCSSDKCNSGKRIHGASIYIMAVLLVLTFLIQTNR